MKIIKQIVEELDSYSNGEYEISEGVTFSPSKLVRRIMLYKNKVYTTGKLDSQGNYKYWFDIITPRVNAEIKNIDFDTKDIMLFSDAHNDAGRLLIANARLKEYMRENGEAEKLNESVEINSEWGNVVWKKVKDGYKTMELNHFFVLNPTAKCLDDSDVIEECVMYPNDIRGKMDIWENVPELLNINSKDENKTSPEYWIYERNGDISERDLFEAIGKRGGDENKYLLAKVIVGGIEKGKPTVLLYCDVLSEKPYKEAHRSSYSGRWIRVGLYETLFDIQTRANQIGNQIARGLEWSSKTIFRSTDRLFAQNILTDLQNGDIVKSTDLTQVNTRMDGMDQLIADWNRLMQLADQLANSYEVVTGSNMPSGTPFSLAAQQNMNANKLFDFIREKLCIAFQDVIQDWILPGLLKDLKAKDVIRLTADSGALERYYAMIVDEWYIDNLLAFPPHSTEQAAILKDEMMQQLLQNKETVVSMSRDMWKSFSPRVIVSITGENYNLIRELESLKSFIALEQDPVRRTALIEQAMQKTGIDTSTLPKTEAQPQQPQAQPLNTPPAGRQEAPINQ